MQMTQRFSMENQFEFKLNIFETCSFDFFFSLTLREQIEGQLRGKIARIFLLIFFKKRNNNDYSLKDDVINPSA